MEKYVFADSKFYIFEDNVFDDVKITGKIEIIGNENIISKIEKVKYGINNSTKTIDIIINEIDERRRTHSDDNDNTKNRRATRENDRLSNRKQNQVRQEYDNRQNDRNSQELDNSSFYLKENQNNTVK